MAVKYDINRDGDDYVWKIKVGGSLVEVMRVTPAGAVTFTAGGSPSGSISASGLWTIGPVGYVGTHQVNGSVSATGTVSASGGLTGVGATPVGTVVAWIPGYFADGSNGTYTKVLGTTDNVSGANAYLNSLGWCVCDGSAVNDVASPIFNGTNRYVPNLTDRRFLQGSLSVVVQAGEVDVWNAIGNIQGGSNTLLDHTHAVTGVGVGTIDISHAHGTGTLSNAGEAAHTHTKSGGVTALGSTSLSHSGGAVTNLGSTSMSHSSGAVTNLGSTSLSHSGGAVGADDVTSNKTVSQSSSAAHAHQVDGYWRQVDSPSGGDAHRSAVESVVFNAIYTKTDGGHDHSPYISAGNFEHSHSFTQPSAHDIAHGHGFTQPSAHDIAHGHGFTQPSAHDIAHGHSDNISYGTGSSHTHTISGSTATGGSTTLAGPLLSGVTGTGNTAPNTENRPKYLRCFMIIRFK